MPNLPLIAAATEPATRVAPPCPHFGPCGGCQLQNLAYDAQLALKATQLRTLLAPTGIPFPELELHPSPPLAYRNRVRFTLAEVDRQLRAGYIRNPIPSKEAAATFLPITQCPIAAPILWRAAEALLELLNRDRAQFSPLIPDQLELFTTADEAAMNLTLTLRGAVKSQSSTKLDAAFTGLCEGLRSCIPELAGAGIALLPAASGPRSRRAESPRPGPVWGAPGIHYAVAGTSYWVPRTAFFQVNRFLLPDLVSLVVEWAERSSAKTLAWDLYAGAGLFSKALARLFAEVTAVEVAEAAFSALVATKLRNLRAIQATTLDFLRGAAVQRERPALIVLDPPRSGAGPEVCALLARIAAPTLVYVSCSPQTLPADLATLTASGYTLEALHLFDLFPQTTHIETVAILRR